MTQSGQLSFRELILLVIGEQSPHVQNVICDLSVFSSFDLDTIRAMSPQPIDAAQANHILEDILRLNTTQPFGDNSFRFHVDVRNILLDKLLEDTGRAIGVYQRAIRYLQDELSDVSDVETRRIFEVEKGALLVAIGDLFYGIGDYAGSISSWEESVQFFRQAQSPIDQAETHSRLGKAYIQVGNAVGWIDAYLAAAQVFLALDDPERANEIFGEAEESLTEGWDWAGADELYAIVLTMIDYGTASLDSERSIVSRIAGSFAWKGDDHVSHQRWDDAIKAYDYAVDLHQRVGDSAAVSKMERKMNRAIDELQQKQKENVLQSIRNTLNRKLPQLVNTAGVGLVPLSIALSLIPLIESPEKVFVYLAGLAPNFIADMLKDLRSGRLEPDVEDMARAISEHLDDSSLHRFADELQVITAAVQALQAQGEQVQSLSQRLSQELQSSQWLVPERTQVVLADMAAHGHHIAQAKEHSIALVASGGATINVYKWPEPKVPVKTRRWLRAMIGAGQDVPEEGSVLHSAILGLPQGPGMPSVEPVYSQSISQAEIGVMIRQNCDLYLGVLGAKYNPTIRWEIETAREMDRPVLLYCKAMPDSRVEEEQTALIRKLENTSGIRMHSFTALGEVADGSLPPEVLKSLRATLLQCDPLASDAQLRAVFVDERIAPWKYSIPEAQTIDDRVNGLIYTLSGRKDNQQRSALALALRVLADQVDEKDCNHDQLKKLAETLETGNWSLKLKDQVQRDVLALLSGELCSLMPAPRVRALPSSGRRGLIASLGRSPGAVTGLCCALNDAEAENPIHYVRTISTTEFQVRRARRAVEEELKRQGVEYEDVQIDVEEFRSEEDVRKFKQALSRLVVEAREAGDSLAVGIAGGRTVMGALLAMVSQMEAPADSFFLPGQRAG